MKKNERGGYYPILVLSCCVSRGGKDVVFEARHKCENEKTTREMFSSAKRHSEHALLRALNDR